MPDSDVTDKNSEDDRVGPLVCCCFKGQTREEMYGKCQANYFHLHEIYTKSTDETADIKMC